MDEGRYNGFLFVFSVKRCDQYSINSTLVLAAKASLSIGSNNFIANGAGLVYFEYYFIQTFITKPSRAFFFARNTIDGKNYV